MSVREIVVLGTASQVPTRTRSHHGCLLRWDGEVVLFDPGEGTQRQLTLAGVSAASITRICVTHFHGDHCLGLPGVIQRLSLDGVTREVPLHYPAQGQEYLDRLRYAAAFRETTPLTLHPTEPEDVVDGNGYRVEAQPLDHPVPTVGWRIVEPDSRRMLPDRLATHGVNGPAVSELAEEGRVTVDGRTVHLEEVSAPRPGQVVAFVMDTRLCDGARELAEGADLLVCESTFLDEDRDLAEEYAHLTARQAAELARDAGVRRLVLTHFSQRYPQTEVFAREARAVHGDVHAVRDLDRVALPARRVVSPEVHHPAGDAT